ncbi:PREDICTED: glutathione S-transferase T3-like [Brassica oleracea var. oleracea]|uniref:glutathione S-transferase T3-like n=1 Tax=Brassica oleracea var. oleracea TaxID=109376 RepID=UPI0006A6D961|nr:PREDICTED: glutathione S-transferase T3-like [Brassica oleracea var. oleracea]
MSSLPSPDLGGSASRAQSGEDRKQRCKWSTAEDLVLISTWLNTSKDPLVRNEQRAGTFWKRIAAYYNASPKVVGLAKKEQSHCKQRWGKINEGVYKFAAHEIFFNDYNVKLSLEHAWRKLRNDQKWCGTYGSSQQSSGSKRKRVGEEQSFQSSASMPSVNGEDEVMARPIGVKTAKAKAKRPVGEEGKNLQELRQMWEIKANDLAMKDKLSKTKLLDSLLAKTEPLSELKVALKNKLITEMLSK